MGRANRHHSNHAHEYCVCLCAGDSAYSGALLLLSLSLGGCASSPGGSSLMYARTEVTDHLKTIGYLAVEDVPPRPDKPAMTADEQLKLKKELIAARDRQTKI